MAEAMLGGGMAADSKAAKKDVELLQSVQVAELAVRDLWKSPMRDSLEFFGNRPYHSPVSNLFSFLSISKTGHAKPAWTRQLRITASSCATMPSSSMAE